MNDTLARRIMGRLQTQRDIAWFLINKLMEAAYTETITREQIIDYLCLVSTIPREEIEMCFEYSKHTKEEEIKQCLLSVAQQGDHNAAQKSVGQNG